MVADGIAHFPQLEDATQGITLTVFIYGLLDPRSGAVRYVGVTKNLRKRLYGHLRANTENGFKRAWISELAAINLKPEMIVIEGVSDKEWRDREIFWIAYYRERGELLNVMDGGERGYDVTEAIRRVLSRAHKGIKLSDAAKQKLSIANKGRRPVISGNPKGNRRSPETCNRISESKMGHGFTQSDKTKMSESRRAYYDRVGRPALDLAISHLKQNPGDWNISNRALARKLGLSSHRTITKAKRLIDDARL